jgi:hypothetical protein
MLSVALLALAACPADVPPALALRGVPAAAIPGRTITAGLERVAEGEIGDGSTLGVHDPRGVGWEARFPYVFTSQQFSVGLNGPFTVKATYTENLPSGACTRELTAALPIERRIYAVAGCSRRAIEPSRLTLRCGGKRLRLRALSWTGWNDDVAVGRGADGLRVKLSHPRECSSLNGFIYTRARVNGGKRIPIACPII